MEILIILKEVSSVFEVSIFGTKKNLCKKRQFLGK